MESLKLDDENDGTQSDCEKLPRAGTVLNKKPSIENISTNNIEETVKANDQSEDTSNNEKVDTNNSFSGTDTSTKKEETEENPGENEQHNFSETSVTTDIPEKVQEELHYVNNTFSSENGHLEEADNVDSGRQKEKLDEETLKGKDEIIKNEDIPPSVESAIVSEKDSGFQKHEEGKPKETKQSAEENSSQFDVNSSSPIEKPGEKIVNEKDDIEKSENDILIVENEKLLNVDLDSEEYRNEKSEETKQAADEDSSSLNERSEVQNSKETRSIDGNEKVLSCSVKEKVLENLSEEHQQEESSEKTKQEPVNDELTESKSEFLNTELKENNKIAGENDFSSSTEENTLDQNDATDHENLVQTVEKRTESSRLEESSSMVSESDQKCNSLKENIEDSSNNLRENNEADQLKNNIVDTVTIDCNNKPSLVDQNENLDEVQSNSANIPEQVPTKTEESFIEAKTEDSSTTDENIADAKLEKLDSFSNPQT